MKIISMFQKELLFYQIGKPLIMLNLLFQKSLLMKIMSLKLLRKIIMNQNLPTNLLMMPILFHLSCTSKIGEIGKVILILLVLLILLIVIYIVIVLIIVPLLKMVWVFLLILLIHLPILLLISVFNLICFHNIKKIPIHILLILKDHLPILYSMKLIISLHLILIIVIKGIHLTII